MGIEVEVCWIRTNARRQVRRQGLVQREINAQREDLHDSWTELRDQQYEFEWARRRAVDW